MKQLHEIIKLVNFYPEFQSPISCTIPLALAESYNLYSQSMWVTANILQTLIPAFSWVHLCKYRQDLP